jgi:cell wall assembly regulator SMI1
MTERGPGAGDSAPIGTRSCAGVLELRPWTGEIQRQDATYEEVNMALPISDSWTRIIEWLRVNGPADCLDVFPAAPRDQIVSTAAEIGIVFPDQLVEFYERLDGAESGSVLPSPDDDLMAFDPMPLEEVSLHWAGQKELVKIGQFDDCTPLSAAEIQNVWWDTGWIPFASNGAGDYLCVDTAPTAAGHCGQIISHSHETGEHRLLSPSLADYLLDLATRLEQGLLVFDDKYGLCPVSSPEEEVQAESDNLFTGMSEWHYANAITAAEEAFKNKDYSVVVAHLERFESRLDKLPASRLAYARKKIAQT